MPAPEHRPEPLQAARRRLEFDTLVRRRYDGLVTPVIAAGPVGQGRPLTRREEQARLLESLAREFADAVDRENSTRSILRSGVAVDYVDAVVLTGSHGVLVVDAELYDEAPVYAEARAGVADDGTVIRGRDLDGYLRTGSQEYAERIGLA